MSIDTGYDVLLRVLEDEQPQGWAIEFGVYSGYSLELIAARMPVIGLDSFEGLPEDWREGFPKGSFYSGEIASSLPYTENAMIIKGLFEDTLPGLTERGIPLLGLVHIDCDLYSSTVTALEGVYQSIDVGTIFVFDEFHGYPGAEQHEEKAWREFTARYGITAETIQYGEQERAFVVHDIMGSSW